ANNAVFTENTSSIINARRITRSPAAVAAKLVCERPPAAFGGSPPHEGRISFQVAGFILPLVRGRRERSEREGPSPVSRGCTLIQYPLNVGTCQVHGTKLCTDFRQLNTPKRNPQKREPTVNECSLIAKSSPERKQRRRSVLCR